MEELLAWIARGLVDDPDAVHDQLCEVVPRRQWTRATHLLIVHGRRTCYARRPACPRCPVLAQCPWPGKETVLRTK